MNNEDKRINGFLTGKELLHNIKVAKRCYSKETIRTFKALVNLEDTVFNHQDLACEFQGGRLMQDIVKYNICMRAYNLLLSNKLICKENSNGDLYQLLYFIKENLNFPIMEYFGDRQPKINLYTTQDLNNEKEKLQSKINYYRNKKYNHTCQGIDSVPYVTNNDERLDEIEREKLLKELEVLEKFGLDRALVTTETTKILLSDWGINESEFEKPTHITAKTLEELSKRENDKVKKLEWITITKKVL